MAQTLKDLRLNAGLTLAQVAEAVGSFPSAPSAWERGEWGPRPRVIPLLAKLYKITPAKVRMAIAASRVAVPA